MTLVTKQLPTCLTVLSARLDSVLVAVYLLYSSNVKVVLAQFDLLEWRQDMVSGYFGFLVCRSTSLTEIVLTVDTPGCL